MKTFFVTKSLYVLHQNIAGLINKADALSVSLNMLEEKHKNIDLLCISEHFMMEGEQRNLYIPNFCLAAHYCRPDSKRGGTCILVREGHIWKNLPDIAKLSIRGVFECCAIELVNYKLIVICLYRVPKQVQLNTFFQKLEQF